MPPNSRVLYMRLWMIGVLLGIAASLLPPQLLAVPPLLLLAIGAVALLAHRSQCVLLYSGAMIGLGYGLFTGQAMLDRRLGADCERLPSLVEGSISSLPLVSRVGKDRSRQRFEFSLERIQPQRCAGPQRLLLSYYGEQTLQPGERWRFQVILKKPWGLANPGTFNVQDWYAQKGIDGTGSVRIKGAQRLSVEHGGWHHRLRQRVSNRVAMLDLDSDVQGVLRAVTVADKSGLDASLWTLMQHFGVNHLLVISGLHIGLCAGLGYVLGKGVSRLIILLGVSWLPWVLPGLFALAFGFAYAAMAGFALSTVRALCMLGCYVLAGFSGRSSTAWNSLLLAALIVVLLNPLALVGSGFWLSFTAVACLLWLSQWQQSRGWRRALSTHGYMSLAMLPMGAWWFGGASQVAALANILMVPLVGLVIVPLALLAMMAMFLGLEVETLLWRAAAWPVEQILPLAYAVQGHSDPGLYRHMLAGPLPFVLALLGIVLVVVPDSPRLRLLALLLVVPLILKSATGQSSSDYFAKLTILDVGQGTSVVLRSKTRTLVYDTGGGDPIGNNMARSVVLPYLRAQGVESIDNLLISHPDQDHSAGTIAILQAMPVRQLLYGGDLPDVGGGRHCRAGEAWRWPSGVAFQILSPATEPGLSSNNSSCVLHVEIGGVSLLLPGDIDAAREQTLVRYWRRALRADWMLAAHHGSLSSSSYALLKSVDPDWVVYSSGYRNRFGHPHARILTRFGQRGVTGFSTAASGALEVYFYPDQSVVIDEYRARYHPYWW
ncbi:MAG: DNA internalization-related competence protein ComEC/Rec2 [Halieaceae bacterium]|nr:DNA internalization-related competence protein ComEC/Rec2 [Halieaceae bacterium]